MRRELDRLFWRALGRLRFSREVSAYRALGLLGLTLGVVWAIISRHDVGLTIDEPSQMRYARWIAAWFVTGFQDQRALVRDYALARYGGLFEALSQLVVHFTPDDAVGTRHAASALCALAGIAAAYKMAERLDSQRSALTAALLLATTPVWVGHGLFNPKDIPFGTAAAWSAWAGLSILMSPTLPSYRLHVACGIALGAAVGVRPGGMFLMAYPLGAWLGRWALFARRSQRHPELPVEPLLPRLRAALLRLCVCWAVAWVWMVVAWPWAQLDPLHRPWEAARFAANSPWGGSMLFDGHLVSAQHLPASYLPVWLGITLPETYFLAAACGAALLWRACRRPTRIGRAALGLAYVATAAFGPVLMQVITRAVVYDAQRHFLFVLPPMAALAGVLLSRFMDEPGVPAVVRQLTLSLAAAMSLVLCWDMVCLHPYEYVYFNRFVGGISGAASRYETDYWGASNTEGMRWVAQRFGDDEHAKLSVATCQNDESVRLYLELHPSLSQRIKLERRSAYADILLADTRNNCHKTPGRVLHVVERQGVPLLYVIQRRAFASSDDPPAPGG